MNMFEWILIFILLISVFVLFYFYTRLKGQVESRATVLFNEWKEHHLTLSTA